MSTFELLLFDGALSPILTQLQQQKNRAALSPDQEFLEIDGISIDRVK
jgi:hypothetical protein